MPKPRDMRQPLSEGLPSKHIIRFGIPATCYRTVNAQIPKSAGESAGKSAGEKGTAGGTGGSSAGRPVSLEKQRNGSAPSSPPSSPLFPGTLPSTLPGTFGDLGVFSPVAGRWDSNIRWTPYVVQDTGLSWQTPKSTRKRNTPENATHPKTQKIDRSENLLRVCCVFRCSLFPSKRAPKHT